MFHDFHTSWITHLKETLNDGLLPPDYDALAEQLAGEVGPDVLTIEAPTPPDSGTAGASLPRGATAVAETPPKVSVIQSAEQAFATAKRRTLVIRHATGDRIIALIEIVSPGNKAKRVALERFVDKAVSALSHGYHLLIVDLFPPGPHDPGGIHGALWAQIEGGDFELPAGRPLTFAAYAAGIAPTAYVEPTAVGAALPAMPVFLDPGWYVNVPLQEPYDAAVRGVPKRWRDLVETP